MRLCLLTALLALSACAPTLHGATEAALRGGAQQAYFENFPEVLFLAIAETCAGPAQTVVRPNRDEIRCETLPTPQDAAGLILEHNGTVENLPRFIYGVKSVTSGDGRIVTADTYISVPQRDGGIRRIRLRDAHLEAEMREILILTGGRPL
jgi:hypothetical protein